MNAFSILLFAFGLLTATSSNAQLPASRHRFTVIAHRADHVAAPENSIAAIDSAIAHGADYVELDLRTSADSVLVIMHDATVERTTNGKGLVSKLTRKELDSCYLKNSHETVPDFETCLQHCAGKINIYLDFKNADAGQTMKLINKYKFEKSVLVYINTPAQYTSWRTRYPSIPVIISLPGNVKTPAQLEAFLKEHPAEVLDGGFSIYTPEILSRAASLGIKVWPDIQGADESNNWPLAVEMGFNGLQTDHPQALIAWLVTKGIR